MINGERRSFSPARPTEAAGDGVKPRLLPSSLQVAPFDGVEETPVPVAVRLTLRLWSRTIAK
jgi:hypothetical protein